VICGVGRVHQRNPRTKSRPKSPEKQTGPSGWGVTCQITRLPRPHGQDIAPQPSGTVQLSSAQASGWRASEEGDGLLTVVTPLRLPDSEARRRIPASCPFPESLRRQLRAVLASLAASDSRSELASLLHRIPQIRLGERTKIVATVPTGLADSREPTCTRAPMVGNTSSSRDRAGVLAYKPHPSIAR